MNRPDDIFIDGQDNVFVAELGFRAGVRSVPHFRLMTEPPHGHDPIARVGIYDPDGAVQRLIGGEEEVLPGNFIAPARPVARLAGRPLRRRGHGRVGCGGTPRAVDCAVLPEVHPFGVAVS